MKRIVAVLLCVVLLSACLFGCGKSGDIFTFIMEKEGLSFPEALLL